MGLAVGEDRHGPSFKGSRLYFTVLDMTHTGVSKDIPVQFPVTSAPAEDAQAATPTTVVWSCSQEDWEGCPGREWGTDVAV